jgi:hypothetical protein
VLTSLAQDIFKVIALTPGCTASIESRLVPTLVSILETEGAKVTLGLQAVALDVLQTLVRANAGSKGENPRPLSQLLVASAFPAAVRCTLQSDDNAVTQVKLFIMASFLGRRGHIYSILLSKVY